MKRQQNEPGRNRRAASSHSAANAQRILEYADGGLAAADALLIEEHLQSCRECQLFYQRARELSAALEHGIKCAGLSPSFAARLWEKLDSSAKTEAACLQQKQRMQMEFEQYSARLRKQLFRLPNLLDAISYSVAILVSCYVLFAGFGGLTGMLAESWPSLEQHRLLLFSGVIVTLSTLLGLTLAFKDQTAPLAEES